MYYETDRIEKEEIDGTGKEEQTKSEKKEENLGKILKQLTDNQKSQKDLFEKLGDKQQQYKTTLNLDTAAIQATIGSIVSNNEDIIKKTTVSTKIEELTDVLKQ